MGGVIAIGVSALATSPGSALPEPLNHCCGWYGRHHFNCSVLRSLREESDEEGPPLKRARASPKMKEPSPGPPYARTPARNLKQFDRAFEEEMDAILIQPDWFESGRNTVKKKFRRAPSSRTWFAGLWIGCAGAWFLS
jgi:hypothetical protein